jgi:hypothetical protein
MQIIDAFVAAVGEKEQPKIFLFPLAQTKYLQLSSMLLFRPHPYQHEPVWCSTCQHVVLLHEGGPSSSQQAVPAQQLGPHDNVASGWKTGRDRWLEARGTWQLKAHLEFSPCRVPKKE